jgi:uncharacterized protein (TIGR02145 family)
MRKNVFFSIWLLLSLCTAAVSSAQNPSTPEFVVINGVRWATCNVDYPGTFAASPESPGKFYQWNRSKVYPTTGWYAKNWDDSSPSGFWSKKNDPSPAGYRVPTNMEIQLLFDVSNVSIIATPVNGVYGLTFTDKKTGASIFLPSVGYRSPWDGQLKNYSCGRYWGNNIDSNQEEYSFQSSDSKSKYFSHKAFYLYFNLFEDYLCPKDFYREGFTYSDYLLKERKNIGWRNDANRTEGFCIRPVVDDKTPSARISIQLDKNGIFSSGENVTSRITAEENLTEVIIMKDDGEVIETITSFDAFPVLKGENGRYSVSLSDLAHGSYALIAMSETTMNSVKFKLIKIEPKEEIPAIVEINGVRWATRNVDQPGTFTTNPEDAGMYYQWNRKQAWPATDSVTGWDNSDAPGNSWAKENDPSPAGYRVPTIKELKRLLDKDKVSIEPTWVKGIAGCKFTDKATGASIFLPAAGYRYNYCGTLNDVGKEGYYWSNTARKSSHAYSMSLRDFYNNDKKDYRRKGFSVRPVAE